MNLKNRSYQHELLDADDIPVDDLAINLKELDVVNTWLGGHKITVAGIKEFVKNKSRISVCEIGCGGGDNLVAISKWFKKHNINAEFIGVDIKENCIAFAEQKAAVSKVNWITSDYKNVQFKKKPDVIFSSLFCHHFLEEELIYQLRWMKENSLSGFFINDLQRHVVAYHSIKILTAVFSNSYLVKNDAPLSVARGFTTNEWRRLLNAAQIDNYKIENKWAFRHLISYKHE